MATATFVAWLPEVQPEVMECPQPVILNAIRNACIEFCRTSLCWQYDYGSKTLAASDLPFAVDVPADSSLSLIMSAVVEGRPLTETNMDELKTRVFNWQNATGNPPEAYFMRSLDVVDFYPRPPGVETFDVLLLLALEPARDATGVDDTVYNSYLEDVAAGALYRLMMMPGKPWSNMEAAKYYYSKFRSAMTNATVDVNRSYTRGDLRIQMKVI